MTYAEPCVINVDEPASPERVEDDAGHRRAINTHRYAEDQSRLVFSGSVNTSIYDSSGYRGARNVNSCL